MWFKTPFHPKKTMSAKPWVHPFHSLFHVQSGKGSGPRRKAPGIPVNKDTAATKLGKPLWLSITSENFKGPFFSPFFCVLGPVKPSLPPPGGDVVKYSSQHSDHLIPSQDVQGIWILEYTVPILCCIQFNFAMAYIIFQDIIRRYNSPPPAPEPVSPGRGWAVTRTQTVVVTKGNDTWIIFIRR